MLGDTDNFMRLRRQYDQIYQPAGYAVADNQYPGVSHQVEEPPIYFLDSYVLWLIITVCFFLIICGLFYLGHQIIKRTRSKKITSDSERPFDPYLKCTNTSLDASLIAANEPSFKHTTIPPRAYCTSDRRPKPCNDGEFQWYTGPRALSIASCPTSAGFGLSGTRCYPNVIWDSQNGYSTSTPNESWKDPKHASCPPAYPQSEGISNTSVEKRVINKV